MTDLILDWSAAVVAGPARTGGKGWPLAVLAGLGVPTPPGFVIDAAAVTGRRTGEALPEPLSAALACELDRRGWTDRPLAVRSSAVGEDSAHASFAGIFRTCLNVLGHAALVDAVESVLDSAASPAATAYRERLGPSTAPAAMAVVVMPLVPAVASGVAFSSDPVGGRADRWLIHAHWGLGESLVGGLADPDEIVLTERYPDDALVVVSRHRGTKARMTIAADGGGTHHRDTPADLGGSWVLDDAQAIALGELVREVATLLDHARPLYDVEWVWDGNAFWIVQARPISTTVRRTYPALRDQPMVWSRANSRDVVPDPLPALDRSISLPLIDHMLTRNAELAGYPLLPGVQRTDLHHGRLYFETSILQWESFDSFGVPPKSYNRLLGGHQPDIVVPRATVGDRCRRALRGMRFLGRSLGTRLRARSILARAHAAAAGLRAQPLPADPSALAAQLRVQVNCTRTDDALQLLQASGSATVIFIDLLDAYVPEEGPALAGALMTGGEPSVTAALGTTLMRLAEAAAAEPETLAWLQAPGRAGREWKAQLAADSAFGRGFDALLREFGHRGVYESYLHRPRWNEEPDYLLDTVLGLIGCAESPVRKRRDARRDAALRRIRQRLPIWRRPSIPLLTRLARHERNLREGARSAMTAQSGIIRRIALALGEHWVAAGALPSADQVFHLTLHELFAAADGRLALPLLARRAAWRQRQYDAELQREAPEVIVDDRVARSSSTASATASSAPTEADEWRGIVASGGHAGGVAHVAHQPGDTLTLIAGAILVVPATDPSWTPAFLKAGAIVMETGGYLSHGAIVAREFGIPAVVNVPGILDAIRSGDRIEVDADRGVVRRRPGDTG